MYKLLFLPLFIIFGFATALYAVDTSGTLYTSSLLFFNNGLDRENYAGSAYISCSGLTDSGFMTTNALNAVMHQGSTVNASMPCNGRIVVEGQVLDDGGSFTEQTAAAQSTTQIDFALLPVAAVSGDAAYFGFDNPARILTLDIGQIGVGDWSLNWQYETVTGYEDLTNVEDQTDDFQLLGRKTVSWDQPLDWVTGTITGSAVNAYWIRATATVTGASTQQAIGSQAQYENGQWWVWVGDHNQGTDSVRADFSLGGAPLVTHHQIFPGTAGIITPDDSTMELGDTYIVVYEGSLNVTNGVTGSDKCLVCKLDAFNLYLSDEDEVTLDITGSGGTTLVVDGITLPVTGSHRVSVFSDGTDVTLEVVNAGSAVGTARTIADNSNTWEFASQGSTIYIDSLTFATPAELSLFNSLSDWNTGTLVGVTAEGGSAPADPNQNVLVESSTDDVAWAEGTTTFFDTINQCIMGFSTSGQFNCAAAFNDIDLDQGETIVTAVIEFTGFSSQSATTVNLTMGALQEDSASICTSYAGCDALVTGAVTGSWLNVPAFVDNTTINSPDIADILQEVIDRPGWENGNNLVILFKDHDGDPSNPSDTLANRQSGQVDDNRSAWRLIFTTVAQPLPPDDFIALEQTGSTQDEDDHPFGWTKDDDRGPGGTDGAGQVVTDFVQFGSHSFENWGDSSASGGSFTENGLGQVLTASPGQVWSASIYSTKMSSSTNADPRFQINWLDSGLTEISSVEVNIPVNGNSDRVLTEINGETAPAGTAFIEVRLYARCSSVFGCDDPSDEYIRWDGVMACICATALTFPDSSNLLTNPSFEDIYTSPGTWRSPTANPTATDALFATVSWNAFEPPNTTLLAETSIDGASSWQVVTNGGRISGIEDGDDLSSMSINLRFTFTSTDQTFSSIVGLAAINITDFAESTFRYALETTPGITVDDVSANSNIGIMSYPVELPGIGSLIFPLTPTLIDLESSRDLTTVLELLTDQTSQEATGGSTGSGIAGKVLVDLAATALDFDSGSMFFIIIMMLAVVLGIAGYLSMGTLGALLGVTVGFAFGIPAEVVGSGTVIIFLLVGGSIWGISKTI